MSDRDRFYTRLAERNWTGISLRPEQVERFFTYYELLLRWNSVVNLTALPLVGLPDDTLDRLFMEPLVASRFIPDLPIRWLDIGSGGGSPAIPLGILRPRARLTMTEPKARKAGFLREAVRALELTGEVCETRVEEWVSSARGSIDTVSVRAVRLDLPVMKAARTCLKRGGRFLSFSSQASSGVKGFRLCEEAPLGPGGGQRASRLFVYERE